MSRSGHNPEEAEKKRGKQLSAEIAHDSREETCLSTNHCDYGAGTSDTEPRSLDNPLSQKEGTLIGSTSDK